MSFDALLARFTCAVVERDIAGFSALFAVNGIYDDVFYGRFCGRESIGQMLDTHFHGNAKDFFWEMHDPVCVGDVGYTHYTFSYTSTMHRSQGQRAVFTGAANFVLSEGLIAHYREWAYGLAGLTQLGVPAEIVHRQATREAMRILDSESGRRHQVGPT